MRNRILPRLLLVPAFAAILFLAVPSFAAQQALYDLDFSTPPHVVGSTPTSGGGPAPRDTVSSGGAFTTVVESYAVLPQQPLRFHPSSGSGAGVRLQIDDLPPCDYYTLEADLAIDSILDLYGALIVYVDAPTIRTIMFIRTPVDTRMVRLSAPGVSTQIGTFEYGHKINLRVEVDLTGDEWWVFLDSELAYTGPFGGATAVSTMRFATNSPNSIDAYLDNVLVGGDACATGVTPGASRSLRVKSYDRWTDVLELRHTPGCAASTHNFIYGPLSMVGSYGYSDQVCDLGMSRDLSIAMGPDSYFFLLVASDGTFEGPYGADAAGAERPAYTFAPACPLVQDLTQRCD